MKYIEESKTKTERLTICLSQEDIEYIKKKQKELGFRSVSSFVRECVYNYGSKAKFRGQSIRKIDCFRG